MIITKPNQLIEVMKECYKHKFPLFIFGQIGVGKSQLVKQFHDKYVGGIFIDERASELDVTDLRGLFRVTDQGTEFVPPKQYLDFTKPGVKGTLFLDEFNLASEDVQKIMYKVILDRKIQQYKFNDDVFIVAAGNKPEEVSIVNEMSPALINRFVIVEYKPEPKYITDYLINKYKPHTVLESFIDENKDNIIEETNPEQNQFTRPRSVERLLQYMAGKDPFNCQKNETDIAMINSILGHNMGKNLINYIQLCQDIDIQALLKNPKSIAELNRNIYFPLVYKIINLITSDKDKLVDNIYQYTGIIGHIPDSEFHLLYVKQLINKVPNDMKTTVYNILTKEERFKFVNNILQKLIEIQR